MCDIHDEKITEKLSFLTTLSRDPGAILSKILQGHSFPTPHPSAKFRPNPSAFPRQRHDLQLLAGNKDCYYYYYVYYYYYYYCWDKCQSIEHS